MHITIATFKLLSNFPVVNVIETIRMTFKLLSNLAVNY